MSSEQLNDIVVLNFNQTQQFTYCILDDLEVYIQEHQAEFEKFKTECGMHNEYSDIRAI